MRGKKGSPHTDPTDPPRRRATSAVDEAPMPMTGHRLLARLDVKVVRCVFHQILSLLLLLFTLADVERLYFWVAYRISHLTDTDFTVICQSLIIMRFPSKRVKAKPSNAS